MPEEKPNAVLSPGEKKVQKFASNSALALELPFTLVGAIAAGVAIGYFADRWLHTRPVLMVILGALGFAAGLREVLRRLPG
jgi:F0F1-type ATP synthase assembly protein I